MKKYLHILAILMILGVGAVLGGTALQALAVSTWTPAPATPPSDNVDAPINVGGALPGPVYTQMKTGKLALGVSVLPSYTSEALRPLLDVKGSGIFDSLGIVNNFVYGKGTGLGITTTGKVLTAVDDNGTVGWGTVGGTGGSGDLQYVAFTGYTGGSLTKTTNNFFLDCTDANSPNSQITYTLANFTGTDYDASKVRFLHIFGHVAADNIYNSEDPYGRIEVTYPNGTYYTILKSYNYADKDGGDVPVTGVFMIPINPNQTTVSIRTTGNTTNAACDKISYELRGVTQVQ